MGRTEWAAALAMLMVAVAVLRFGLRRSRVERPAVADVARAFARRRKVALGAVVLLPLAAVYLAIVAAHVSADELVGIPVEIHAGVGFVLLVSSVLTANLVYVCPRCGRMPLSERAGMLAAPDRCPACGVALGRSEPAGQAPERWPVPPVPRSTTHRDVA